VGGRLRTEVAQLSIIAGVQRPEASNMGMVQRSSMVPVGGGKGNLYVLVDVTGDPRGKEEICAELVEIIVEEYFRVPGGVTNGLRQAIRAANSYLYEMNQESLPLWRKTGETGCAVLRGNDLYMGLAGGAVAYVVKGDHLRVFPRAQVWQAAGLLADEEPGLSPLGVEQFLPDIGLFHSDIGASDLILLGSSALPQFFTGEQVVKAAQGGLQGVTNALTIPSSVVDLSALLVWTAQEQVGESAAQDSLVAKSPAGSPRAETVSRDRVRARKETRSRQGKRGVSLPMLILSLLAGLGTRLRTFFSWLFSSGILGSIGRGLRAVFLSILRGLSALAKQMLPERQAAAQPMEATYVRGARRVSRPGRDRLLPVMGVLGIVCIVAAVAGALVLQNRSRTARFNELLGEARAEMELALDSSVSAEAREHLEKAQEGLGQAAEIRPGDPEAKALQEEVLLAMDEMDRVVRVQFLSHVAFDGLEQKPRRVLLHDGEVFVLDQGTQELYMYSLDGEGGFVEPPGGPVALGLGDQAGSASVEQLNDFVWMESGNGRASSSLLVAVNGGALLEYDVSEGFTPVSVADTVLWRAPSFFGGYFGYLYVLDAEQDRILKYTPTGNSYDSSPADYLQPEIGVELDGAVDMAIDGYVYVLLSDGSILRFQGGAEAPLSVVGLEDHPLRDPTAIFASPDTEYMYIADAGNQRIVQLDKEGVFVRQFRPAAEDAEAFQEVQDVFVDEAAGELLLLSSGALSVAQIPAPPEVE
jgi:hypothetical protein